MSILPGEVSLFELHMISMALGPVGDLDSEQHLQSLVVLEKGKQLGCNLMQLCSCMLLHFEAARNHRPKSQMFSRRFVHRGTPSCKHQSPCKTCWSDPKPKKLSGFSRNWGHSET